jgi:hypothetical protein
MSSKTRWNPKKNAHSLNISTLPLFSKVRTITTKRTGFQLDLGKLIPKKKDLKNKADLMNALTAAIDRYNESRSTTNSLTKSLEIGQDVVVEEGPSDEEQ